MLPCARPRPSRVPRGRRLFVTTLTVVLAVLRARAARGVPACPGDPGCCIVDADCDDGDACTVDRCAPAGCAHAAVDVEVLRADGGATLAPGGCASDRLPRGVTSGLLRVRTLVDRVASRSPATGAPLLRRIIRVLWATGRRAAGARSHGALSAACAGDIAVRTGRVRAHAACLLPAGAAPIRFACLAGRGPLIRLRGERATGYSHRTLAAGTRIDAREAVFVASPANHYPISLDGGAGVCFAGGNVRGRYDRSLGWAEMHDMNNAAVAFANPMTVEGVRIDDVTDGIRPRGSGPFTVRSVSLSYVRDDCVENDHLEAGLIDDALLDGCYVAISERPSPTDEVDGRANLLTVRRSLVRLQPMPGPRDGTRSELGNGEFFKWSERATHLALYDDVFMAERVGQGGPETMGVPDSLVDCARNVMVWLGPAQYPAPLPPCFTVTRDRTVWDEAVARWKRDHPWVGRP